MRAVYKITNPENEVYIGASMCIEDRFKTYRTVNKIGIGLNLYQSLLKFGPGSHTFEIIKEFSVNCEQEDLFQYEIECIKRYKNLGVKLLNLTNGGKGSTGLKHRKESRQKQSLAKKGRQLGADNPNYGKGLNGGKNGRAKAITAYSWQGIVVDYYETISQASRKLRLKPALIAACCEGKMDFAGGYRFGYTKRPPTKFHVFTYQPASL